MSASLILADAAMIPIPTIFHEPWWLKAASGGLHQEVVVSCGSTVVGRLPYLQLSKPGGQKALVMPPMTHILGPALAYEVAAHDLTRSLRRYTIASELIAQLPASSHVWFRLHHGATSTLAFEAAGFTSSLDFTVEIHPENPAALWQNMRDKTRNVIRRAQEKVEVLETHDSAAFMDFYEENLKSRGRRNRFDRHICQAVMEASVGRRVGKFLVAKGQDGLWKAAIFTVWDSRTEYYLMSSRSPDCGNGEISLLLWTAINSAIAGGRIFDVDGVNKRNMILLTGFGGEVKPRFIVSRSSTSYQIAHYVKTLISRRVNPSAHE
jgi:hypothetical protein